MAPILLGRQKRKPGQRPGTIEAYQGNFNKWWREKGRWLFEDRKINRGNVVKSQSFIWNNLRDYEGPTKTNGHTGGSKRFSNGTAGTVKLRCTTA